MDFGKKRKNFQYTIKKGLAIQSGDTRKSIVQSTPNINIFYVEDIEASIDTWLTAEDQVIILTDVTPHIICL
jgi:hypothetical protein